MRAVKKRAEREQNGKQCKKSLRQETRHLSIGKCDVQINPKILEPGLWTTGYGLWIRIYELHMDNK